MDLIHMSMGCHACVIKNVWIHIALAAVQYCDGVKAFIATLEFVGISLRHCIALDIVSIAMDCFGWVALSLSL